MSNESSLEVMALEPFEDEPLHLWHLFLDHRKISPPHEGAGTTTPADYRKTVDDRLGDLFRVGDFLFGSTFEAAINILDQADTMITRVIAGPSQRTAYLVNSSGKQPTVPPKYLCLVPPSGSHSGGGGGGGVFYCSCRSFLEKNARSTRVQLCKHLLAIAVLPHVGVQCQTIETLTEEEFGRLVAAQGSPS